MRRFVMLLFCSWLAAAQAPQSRSSGFTVMGTVTSGSETEVFLLDEAGLPVARTVAGGGGHFQITVQDPGHS